MQCELMYVIRVNGEIYAGAQDQAGCDVLAGKLLDDKHRDDASVIELHGPNGKITNYLRPGAKTVTS